MLTFPFDIEVRNLKVTGLLESAAEDLGTPNEATLTGALVLTSVSPEVQILNGGSSDRNVTLPAISAGKVFYIVNSGTTNKLVVKNAAASTVGNVGPNQTGILIGGATTWRFLLMLGGTTELTATVANLNAVPTATGTGAEIDEMTKNVMSSASTLVLSASAAVQTVTFTSKDADGNTIAAVQRVRFYFATSSTGVTLAAAANGAVAPTTGTILKAHTAKLDWDLLTDTNGVMVMSINNTGGTDHLAVYAVVCLPNGKLKISAVTDVRSA